MLATIVHAGTTLSTKLKPVDFGKKVALFIHCWKKKIKNEIDIFHSHPPRKTPVISMGLACDIP